MVPFCMAEGAESNSIEWLLQMGVVKTWQHIQHNNEKEKQTWPHLNLHKSPEIYPTWALFGYPLCASKTKSRIITISHYCWKFNLIITFMIGSCASLYHFVWIIRCINWYDISVMVTIYLVTCCYDVHQTLAVSCEGSTAILAKMYLTASHAGTKPSSFDCKKACYFCFLHLMIQFNDSSCW